MSDKPPQRGADADRLAKVIARAGLASRRDAEAMIEAGRVTVNGEAVGVATNVTPRDRVVVDGKPLPAPEAARLWLYHKPAGLVTTEKDEKGRETVFDALPDALGRVLSVGRLDLTSEGLLLLTNDGALKRQLELPETGWMRRYRVRVNGHPDPAALERLRGGIEVEGERFAPMQVTLDREIGANAWLTVGLREGRNREIRRAMEAVGLRVNRLIRTSYGPFQLGKLKAGAVEEVRPRVLREQLGGIFEGEIAGGRRAPDEDKRMSDDKGERGKPGSGRGGRNEGGRPFRSRDGEGPRGKTGGKPARRDGKDGPPRKGGFAKGARGRDADAGRDGAGRTEGRRPWPAGDRLVDGGTGRPDRAKGTGGRDGKPGGGFGRGADGKPGGAFKRRDRDGKPGGRPDRDGAGGKPRFAKPPVTRNDRDAEPDRPSAEERARARADYQQRLRDDPSASLRRGGLRGGPKRRKPGKHPKGKPGQD